MLLILSYLFNEYGDIFDRNRDTMMHSGFETKKLGFLICMPLDFFKFYLSYDIFRVLFRSVERLT
jgi:hypothetical protein